MSIEEDINNADYFPLMEEIVNVIEKKTGNNSHTYFRVVTSFFLAQIASNMRCKVKGEVIGEVPVNMYACTLMPSGSGKGHSLGIIEDDVIKGFKEFFIYQTLQLAMETNINHLANKKSIVTGEPSEEITKALMKEAEELGPLPYSFDSGTGAAFKQVRAKAQLCGAGALSFICDEIGANLSNNFEVTAMGLEVFDKGNIKPKITKNSKETKRQNDRDIPVPCNMLWFGTPAKLLDGGKEEENFYTLLQEGYARRMFFADGQRESTAHKSGKALRDALLASNFSTTLENISDKLEQLASIAELNKSLLLGEDEEIYILDYRLRCEAMADELPPHDEIKKSELQNRWWKALKLAGAYAFVDQSATVKLEHILAAIKLAEDSGISFDKILSRDKAYIRLAKYLGNVGKPITQADLAEELPFFKGTAPVRADMINLASAWGYQNGIVIKQFEINKIPFIEGQKLQATDLNHIYFSISNNITYGYQNQDVAWDKVNRLGLVDNLHWCSHHFMPNPNSPELGNYRSKDYALPQFNLIVLDIDGGVSIESTQEVLKEYTYCIYTTKRHTDTAPRYRIILPMKYVLYLNAQDYSTFMSNVYEGLPFQLDEQTKDISRKWLTNKGNVFTNTGELFDPRPYIPNTAQDKERQESYKKYGKIDNITRWFLQKTQQGNRNNNLFRYGMMLKDGGMCQEDIESRILDLNAKLDEPLSLSELQNTVFNSISIK